MTGTPRGYSLMELLVVLAVLAVTAALVAPAVGRTLDGARARAEVGNMAGFLRATREQAVARQQPMEVFLDREVHVLLRRRPGTEGHSAAQAFRPLSPQLRVHAGSSVVFLPHGMSTGARFTIEAPGPRAYVITVDPLTGRVSTLRGAP